MCTAFPSATLTAAQRTALLAERHRQYRALRDAEREGARMRSAAADRARATNGEETTYGQNAAAYAGDELGVNLEDLFDDGAPGAAPNAAAGDEPEVLP
ncbi:UNVERIFIED_ORG: hypothetical protein E4P37_12610 [Bacillus sp. AZ43]